MVNIGRDVKKAPGTSEPFLRFSQARFRVIEQDHLVVTAVKIGQPAKPSAEFDDAAALRRQQVA